MRKLLASLLGIGLDSAKPNIVVIITEGLGYGDLGCYGHSPYL